LTDFLCLGIDKVGDVVSTLFLLILKFVLLASDIRDRLLLWCVGDYFLGILKCKEVLYWFPERACYLLNVGKICVNFINN
jgi:hypothetical protein